MSSTPESTHRVRAFPDLARLKDVDLFASLSEGLMAIHENAARLAEGMRQAITAGNGRAARVLEALADEESGKYLILLDAVRCPRKRTELLAKHLVKAGDHLAKGIYAEACLWRTMDFHHIKDAVQRSRPEYYLDGPTGYDWIFRNSIVALREEMFYVDYVASSDGHHSWWSPERFDAGGPTFVDARAFKVVEAMHSVGLSRSDSLTQVADLWRPVTVDEQLGWHEVLRLNAATLERLNSDQGEASALVQEHWPYPMWSFEMTSIPIKQSELREVQAQQMCE